MTVSNSQLKDFIIDSALVSRAELDDAVRKNNLGEKYLGDTLVAMGKLSPDELCRAEAFLLGVPFVNLSDEKIDFKILALVPEPLARKHNIVAIKKTEGTLEVAMLDMNNHAAIELVKKLTGLRILPRLTDRVSIKSALLRYQKFLKAEYGDTISREANILSVSSNGVIQNVDELKNLAENPAVLKIVDTLFRHAILQGASDIHIEYQGTQTLIRYRIGGVLCDAMLVPGQVMSGLSARVKMLARLNPEVTGRAQNGGFDFTVGEENISCGVSVMPVYIGEKIVLSLRYEPTSGAALESLGFRGVGLQQLYDALEKQEGLVLVVGNDDKEVSKTLYALLNILNRPTVSISTIENSIIRHINGINQTQMKPEIGLSFAQGFRLLTGQDPDVIMASELRDRETASLAVGAALRGRMVLSSLVSLGGIGGNRAVDAISQLRGFEIVHARVASALSVVVGQRSVRRLAEKKEKYYLTPDELAELRRVVDLERVLKSLKEENIVAHDAVWENIPFYRAQKNADGDDGYSGQVGLFEVLKMSPVIRDLIIKGATIDEIEAQAKAEGMVTMIEDGIMKAVQGMTTIEEVLRVVSE